MKHVLFYLVAALFLFNYAIAEEAQPQGTAPAESQVAFAPIKYDEGLLVGTEDEIYQVKLNSLLQWRYMYEIVDNGTDLSTFQIPVARVWLSGNAFKKEFQYMLKFDFGQADMQLLDFYAEYNWKSFLKLRMGQFKVPFNRQEITDEQNLLFADRSLTNEEFNLGRDVGLEVYGYFFDEKFEYRLGGFNGNGIGAATNDNKEPLGVVRLTYMPFGYFPYDERLFEDTGLKMAIGAAAAYTVERQLYNADAVIDSVNTQSDTFDIALKTKRAMFQAEYLYRFQDPEIAGVGNRHGMGYYAQLGYFIVPKLFELGARYGQKFDDVDDTNAYRAEVTPIFNWYFYKTKVKVQTEYSYQIEKTTTGAKTNDHIFLTQVQFSF